jgi:hypothetical protein
MVAEHKKVLGMGDSQRLVLLEMEKTASIISEKYFSNHPFP